MGDRKRPIIEYAAFVVANGAVENGHVGAVVIDTPTIAFVVANGAVVEAQRAMVGRPPDNAITPES